MNNFLWGTATSSHQVEGGNFYNDWWEWERLGKIKTKDSSHPSCNHYNLYKEDFKLIKDLSNNAYRFSVEWSRIEKEEGKFDEKEIEHYVDMLKELKRLNIEPLLTLHHFTIPIWLYKKGGFLNENFLSFFERFVKKVVPYFKDYVKYWVTINEPTIIGLLGYLFGWWPPGEKNFKKCFMAIKNLVLAHMKAKNIIKQEREDSFISIAHNMMIIEPFRKNFLDKFIANKLSYIYNYLVLDALTSGIMKKPLGDNEFYSDLKDSIDYIGVNYYTRTFLSFHPFKLINQKIKKDTTLTDFGYEYYPEGIYEILISLNKYNKPIIITENGIADKEDKLRGDFIRKSIESIKRAKIKGANILGYFYWSLMDNFEWIEGYSMRFGLYEVDFKTLERRRRSSALIYKEICEKGFV